MAIETSLLANQAWLVGADAGLPWLADFVRSGLSHWRSHALIFAGAGSGAQLHAASAYAKAYLCDEAQETQSVLACGRCVSCTWFAAQTHPDAFWAVSEQEQLRYGLTELAGVVPSKSAKPSAELRIATVREALLWAQRPGQHSRRKVVVVSPAQMMNTVSANALLKTLEEPLDGLRLLLCVDSAAQLLPTVRSRCQTVSVPRPRVDEACAWLQAQGVTQPERLLAVTSSAVQAWQWHQAGVDGAAVQKLPYAVAQQQPGLLASWPLPMVLEALIKLNIDAQRCLLGAPPHHFEASALRPWLEQCQSTPHIQTLLLAWQKRLLAWARHENHGWNQSVLQASLLLWRQDC